MLQGICWQEVTERFADVEWLCNEQVFRLLQEKQGLSAPEYRDFVRRFNTAPVQKAASTSLSAEETIALIHGAGGIAILAHPHLQTQHLPGLRQMGLDGVEVDHPGMTEADKAAAWEFATAHSMYRSGGTDHTGLLGNSMKRGAGRVYATDTEVTPYDALVENGAEQADYEAIRARLYG